MIPGQPLIDFGWILDHLDDIALRIWQHIILTAIPVAIGFGIALSWGSGSSASQSRTVRSPSCRDFCTRSRAWPRSGLIPITGISLVTAVIPLVTYTLLILVRSIVAGFRGVPTDVLEAAEGMGYTRRQRLVRVEFPLAIPMMITGLRLATVTVIGLATVASIIGGDTFGGLGQLITEGLQTFFPTKYLLGAGLSILLAFAADFLFIRLERRVTPWTRMRPESG